MFTATTFYRIYIALVGAVSVRGECWIPPDKNGHVVIPKGTKWIPDDAFKKCFTLRRIKFPASLRRIGKNAFTFSHLNKIIFKKGSKLEVIGKYACYECKKLKVVILPASVTDIKEGAFWNTGRLEKVIFKKGSKLKTIERNTFYGSDNLETINIPSSVTEIREAAFANSGLEKVIFEEDSILKTIGESAFERIQNLETINIPSSVTEIGASAFYYSGLDKVIFKEGSELKTIGYKAFRKSDLKTINIPPGVVIDERAFEDTGCRADIFTPGATIVDCIVETKGLRGN